MLDRDTLNVDMLVCYPGAPGKRPSPCLWHLTLLSFAWSTLPAAPRPPLLLNLSVVRVLTCQQGGLQSFFIKLVGCLMTGFFPLHPVPIMSPSYFLKTSWLLSLPKLQTQLQITFNLTSFNVTLTCSPGFTSSRSITLNSLPSRLRRKDLGLPWSF